MARRSTILCLLVAACFVLLAKQLHGQDIAPGQRLLAAKNFKLISRITFLTTGEGAIKRQVIEEFYSNRQKRARIAINRNQGLTGHQVYYYESARKALFVEHNTDPKAQIKCRHVIDNTYLDALLGFIIPSNNQSKEDLSRGLDWLRDLEPEVPNHVVGLARLAFWVDSKRQHFEPSPADKDESINFRNVAAKSYTLQQNYEGFPIPNDRVIAYYPATPDQRDWYGLPLGLYIELKDGHLISIEFINVGPMRDDLEEMNSRMPLDMFAYPIGIDCSKELRLGEWVFDRSADLSFRMEMLDYSGGKSQPASVSDQFIAYDGQTGFMRVDSFKYYKYSISIIDTEASNSYNIFYDTLAQEIERDSRGNYLAGNMFQRSFGQAQCVRTPFSLPTGGGFKPFFNFDKMIPMGRAKIRGVDCRAFEMVTDELPSTLFHPITYVQMDSMTKTAYSIGNDETNGANYNVVFYFAANPVDGTRMMASFRNQALGALMRVDVYLRGELRYHLDISQFSYGKLADAPNGDKAKEMFSLRDRCTTGKHGSLDRAKVNVELTLKISQGVRTTAKEVASFLSSSSLRTRAVTQMLAKSARLLQLDIYDAQSQLRLTDHDDELRIFFEARMSHPDVHQTWPRLIGYAIPTERLDSFPSSSSECLVDAALREPEYSTVIVNCPNRCHLITNPDLEFSEDGKRIVGYSQTRFESIKDVKINDEYCPLLAIETSEPASLGEHELLWLSRWVHSELSGNTLYLSFPGLELEEVSRVGAYGVPATVNHFDINNDHWSTSVGRLGGEATLSAVERDSVEGLGLTAKSGQKYGSSIKNGDEEIPMDYGHCHSICSSRPECRSFSICLTSRGIECIVSEIDFRNASLLEQIEVRRAELESRTAKKTVLLSYTDSSQIELLFDLRCKVHKRNALEMFHKKDSLYLELRNTTLISVDSLEKCAEYCWQNNLVFLNTMEKISGELGDGKTADDETAKQVRAEWDKHSVNWCSSYYYLNLALSSDLEWIKTLMNEKELDEAGLCVPIRPFTYREKHEWPIAHHMSSREEKESPKPKFDMYSFVYSSLYVAQYGKRIMENARDIREKRQVKLRIDDQELCAQSCFLQSEGVEPQCKSFDFIETRLRSTRKMSRYCVLHSSTIEEMEKSGLANMVEDVSGIGSGSEDEYSVRVWHYEPKLHAMGSAMIVKGTLSKLELDSQPNTRFTSFRVHAFGIFLMLLASIVCTAVIVKLKGEAIVDYLSPPVDRRGSMSSIAASLNALD